LRNEKSKAEATAYNDLIAARFKDQKDKRAAVVAKRRSASTKKSESKGKDTTTASK